jgi:hypothetical protein
MFRPCILSETDSLVKRSLVTIDLRRFRVPVTKDSLNYLGNYDALAERLVCQKVSD